MKSAVRVRIALTLLFAAIASAASPIQAQQPAPVQPEMSASADGPQSPDAPSAQKKVFLPMIAKPCVPTNIAQNGSFEAGPANWADTDASQVNILTRSFAYHGSWVGALGDTAYSNTAMYQALNIPAGYTSAKIELYVRVYSLDSLNYVYDTLAVSLQPVGGVSLPETVVAANTSPRSVWRKITVISNSIPNPGQQKRVYLHSVLDGSLKTIFWLDAVSVTVSCSPFAQAATNSEQPALLIDDVPVEPIPMPLDAPDAPKRDLSGEAPSDAPDALIPVGELTAP
jgi:hypothetical protein